MVENQGSASVDPSCIIQNSSHGFPSLDNSINPEDLRSCYQAAVQLAIYDGQLSWQVTGLFVQFAILMIAGAVFPSFIGSNDKIVIAIAGMAVSLAGIIMTSMFGSMVMRSRTYEQYWAHCAIQMESYLGSPVSVLKGSMLLSSEGQINLGKCKIHMSRIAAVKSKVMLGALFICFLLTFLCLFIFNSYRLYLSF